MFDSKSRNNIGWAGIVITTICIAANLLLHLSLNLVNLIRGLLIKLKKRREDKKAK